MCPRFVYFLKLFFYVVAMFGWCGIRQGEEAECLFWCSQEIFPQLKSHHIYIQWSILRISE